MKTKRYTKKSLERLATAANTAGDYCAYSDLPTLYLDRGPNPKPWLIALCIVLVIGGLLAMRKPEYVAAPYFDSQTNFRR